MKTTGLCKGGHHGQCSGSLHRFSGGGPCGCSCHAPENAALSTAAYDSAHRLCPICGELIHLRADLTRDGRLIGSCGDAFTVAQWRA